ncbi:MAG TPA: formate dehydrogenase accessory sulfurtransferase FdhD [Candidatus Limnocylindrales bacterium]|nr:formate dehydrogenase accessory sulfurtransferase FdhD [Candidatus Limnocylindrales bacterium]
MIADVIGARSSAVDVRTVVRRDGILRERVDRVCVEEPLEIRLCARGETRRVAVTMRTPGADLELAAGFVLGEAIVPNRAAIRAIRHCDDRDLSPDERGNVVTVDVRARIEASALLERHFTISSACGVCGTAGIELLRARGLRAIESDARIDGALLAQLPERMRVRQNVFDATGGLHAAALFDLDGEVLAVREDVGRHNAVDKIAGFIALRGIDSSHTALVVSGRCGYEIAQKAIAARIPIVASVSAPSSLAVELANEFGLTLAAFVRTDRWNVYSGLHRIAG